MATVNIGGDPNDVNYRYKRDQIVLEQVKRYGGMRRMQNIDRILSQLSTCRVNVQQLKQEYYKRIKKKGIRIMDGGWFKGDVSLTDLENVLNRLIADVILCPRCKLPEWNGATCIACGHTTPKKQQQGKRMDEDEEGRRQTYPQQEAAVALMKDLYDKRARLQKEDEDARTRMDICIDRFWNIQEQDEKTHLAWIKWVETNKI